jgi:hypothetical protein
VIGIGLPQLVKKFNDFNDFSMAVGKIKKIVNNEDVLVAEINYKNGETECSAVFKTLNKNPKRPVDKDNVAFEYLVGKFGINHWVEYFPCFTYTFALYYHNDEKTHDQIKTLDVRSSDLTGMVHTNGPLESTCSYYGTECLLTQYIRGNLLASYYKDDEFVKTELLKVLFVLYQALNALNNKFTHYDFHPSNVILYELPKNEVFEYKYSDDEGVYCTFKSRYLPKIIDYGRSCCYPVTKQLRQELCAIKKCRLPQYDTSTHPDGQYKNHRDESTCHLGRGLQWLAGPFSKNQERKDFYIDSSRVNRSHDLRLLATMYISHKRNNAIMRNSAIRKFFEKVKFPLTVQKGPNNSDNDAAFAVEEDTGVEPNTILNVMDAYHELLDLVTTHYAKQQYQRHSTHVIHVKSGSPMRYTPP